MFLKETTESTSLSKCFENDELFNYQAKTFWKNLKGKVQKCFNKVRITKKTSNKGYRLVKDLLRHKTELLKQATNTCSESSKNSLRNDIKSLEDEIQETLAENNAKMVREYIEHVETTDGNFSQLRLWKEAL